MYFNLQVGAKPIEITGLTTNTNGSGSPTAGFNVYTRLGTASGFEQNSSGWSLATTGTITPNGLNNPSPVVLGNLIVLKANTLYGFALVMPSTLRHDYTTGNCSNPFYPSVAGSNCFFTDTELTFSGGAATSVPFGGSRNQPRIWNGSISYEIIPEPSSILGLLAIGTGLLVSNRKNRL